MALHAVILAGGSGTRFWPLSRRARPKHLLPLRGSRTLLEETFARLPGLVPPERTVVVTARDQAAAVRRLLPDLPGDAVLAEPRARNTAAAVTLAAARIAAGDPDAVLVVVSADHDIPDGAAFRRTMKAAAARARDARTLVLLGLKPDRPATGYGYILPGRGRARVGGFVVNTVRRFTEKPDLATARRWLRGGEHLWNAGLFAWRADVLLEEVRLRLPRLHRALVASGAAANGRKAALTRAYAAAPSVSVDVGILERSDRVEVLRGTFPWDDLGSFAALARRVRGDQDGNRAARGDLVAVDSRGVLAHGPAGHLTAVLGMEDVAVVTVDGVTLVCPLDRCEEIRGLANRVRRSARHRGMA